jgi:hypothetical protein
MAAGSKTCDLAVVERLQESAIMVRFPADLLKAARRKLVQGPLTEQHRPAIGQPLTNSEQAFDPNQPRRP